MRRAEWRPLPGDPASLAGWRWREVAPRAQVAFGIGPVVVAYFAAVSGAGWGWMFLAFANLAFLLTRKGSDDWDRLRSRLSVPPPTKRFFDTVVYRRDGLTTGRDILAYTVVDGWLVGEGLRSEFALRPNDVTHLALSKEGASLMQEAAGGVLHLLDGSRIVLSSPFHDEWTTLNEWHKGVRPSGEPTLPPAGVHPREFARTDLLGFGGVALVPLALAAFGLVGSMPALAIAVVVSIATALTMAGRAKFRRNALKAIDRRAVNPQSLREVHVRLRTNHPVPVRRSEWWPRPDDPKELLGWWWRSMLDRGWPYALRIAAVLLSASLVATQLSTMLGWLGLVVLSLSGFATRRRRHRLRALLPDPLPVEGFPLEITVQRGSVVTGGDVAVASFVDGWLHIEGVHTAFSLRAADLQGQNWKGGDVRLGLDGDQSVTLSPIRSSREFAQEFHAWMVREAVGVSDLPPQGAHPSALAESAGSLVGGAAMAVVGLLALRGLRMDEAVAALSWGTTAMGLLQTALATNRLVQLARLQRTPVDTTPLRDGTRGLER